MNSFFGRSYLCIFNVLLMSSLSSADTQIIMATVMRERPVESFVENAKSLDGMEERVAKLEKEMKMVKDKLFGEEFQDVLANETEKSHEVSRVTASISRVVGDGIEFKIEHNLNNVVFVGWTIDLIFQPKTKYKQTKNPGYVSMVVPSTVLQTAINDDRDVKIVVYIESSEAVFIFEFNKQPAIEFINTTISSKGVESVSEEIDISTPTVTPAKKIRYSPGDEIVLRIGGRYRNDSYIDWSYFAVSDRPDGTAVISYSAYDRAAPVKISKQSESGKPEITATINTTTLLTGGVIFLTESSTLGGEVVEAFSTSLTIYLCPKTQKDPLPFNRVALDMSDSLVTQFFHLDKPENPVMCMAYGNPTPKMEFRVDGHRMDVEYATWPWEYGELIVAQVPNNLLDHEITCYAESGNAAAEMLINFTAPLRRVEQKSEFRRISDDLIEVKCSMEGKPVPTISFYKGSKSPGNLLFPDHQHVEITNVRNRYTVTSTLSLNISDLRSVGGITCVGESGGSERYKYFPILPRGY